MQYFQIPGFFRLLCNEMSTYRYVTLFFVSMGSKLTYRSFRYRDKLNVLFYSYITELWNSLNFLFIGAKNTCISYSDCDFNTLHAFVKFLKSEVAVFSDFGSFYEREVLIHQL